MFHIAKNSSSCTFLQGGKYNIATEQLGNLHTLPIAKVVDESDLQFEEKTNLFQVSPQDHPSQKEYKWELVHTGSSC